MGSRILWALLAATVVLATTTIGCSTAKESEDVAAQRANLQGLARAYGSYQKRNRGRVPSSEKALRSYIEKNGGPEGYGAETIDEMFISTRDNEPYVVVYKKPKKVVAYESVGVDGKRYIADDLGVVQEVDEATFAEMVPDAK